MRKRDDFMPGQNRLQRAPKLPAGAGDQYFHSAPSSIGSGEWGVGSGSRILSPLPIPHSPLPIYLSSNHGKTSINCRSGFAVISFFDRIGERSEEHTSE